ncbi:MAG: hypothetical protein H0X42_12300 [Solirubrobacterales bacterium]|nr:hypothetical protein [Solirubrobacterales bacterium]
MRRRLLLAATGAVALVLLAVPAAEADVWANVGPASSLAGLASRYPLGNYALDQHFTAISAGVLSGVDVSGLLPMIAYFFANELWQLTAWLASLLVELFGFAFSLDLVNGSSATNGAGALGPVSRAIGSIYSDVFGGPWMVLAVSVAGMWAMWKALVQRRYAETAGQLALSLLYVGIAFLFVLQPGQTIGTASHWTNEMSGAFLSIAKDGEPSSQDEAKEAGADQLFGLLVAQPWAVLEFGGLDHCVKAGSSEEDGEAESVAVQPLPAGAARRLESGEQVSAGGKTCVENLRRYGPHFLGFEPGSGEREEEFEALSHGDSSKLPDADPEKKNGSYELGPLDTPAAATMEKGGQYQRLLVAIVVFFAELGAFCLLGALSVGVITAQVLLLLLLAFSPVALVAAAVPGRGHQFFKGWLSKLAGFLLRKAAYSLVLAVLLAVCAAISAVTSELGWLFSFGLQCAFFWAVFLQRRSLTDGLVGAVTGPGVAGGEKALEVLALYSGARLGARTATRPVRAVGSRLRRGGGRGVEARREEIVPPTTSGETSRPHPDRPEARTDRDEGPATTRSDAPAARPRPDKADPKTMVEGSAPTGKTGKGRRSEEMKGDPSRPRPAEKSRRPEPGEEEPRRPRRRPDKKLKRPSGAKRSSGGPKEQVRQEAAEGPPADRRKDTKPSPRPAPTRPSPRSHRPQQGGLAEELRADDERAKAARKEPAQAQRTGKLPEPRPRRRPKPRPEPQDNSDSGERR